MAFSRLIVISLALMIAGTLPVRAAVLYFESSSAEYRSEETFIADLKIDNQGECINTVKADIGFSNELLEASDFIKGDSILVFWIEDPSIKQDQGLVSFVGGVPGGYCGKISGDSGPGNTVGKIAFKVKGNDSQNAEIKFLDTSEVLLNDGMGTKADLSVRELGLKIRETVASPGDEWQKEKISDNIPPEPFTVEIGRNSKIFEDKYFAVFSASDKQTGIDHYEVKEGSGGWIKADNPYLLRDQSLKSAVLVKAVDKAGNERLAEFDPLKPEHRTEAKPVSNLVYALMILLIAVIVLIIIKKLIPSILGKKQNEK